MNTRYSDTKLPEQRFYRPPDSIPVVPQPPDQLFQGGVEGDAAAIVRIAALETAVTSLQALVSAILAAISNDTTMAANSAVLLPTQHAAKTYADTVAAAALSAAVTAAAGLINSRIAAGGGAGDIPVWSGTTYLPLTNPHDPTLFLASDNTDPYAQWLP